MDLNNELLHPIKKRFKKGVFPSDYLVFFYGIYLILVCLLFYNKISLPGLYISLNLVMMAILLISIYFEERNTKSAIYWLHTWMPLISLTLYYTQSTVFDNLFFAETFDNLLQKWDFAFFGVSLNRVFSPLLNSLFVDEVMHMFYFSFYLILFIPGIIMLSRQYRLFHEMVFSITLMMYIHYCFFMFFPGDGPICDRGFLFQNGIIFIPLMNFIYRVGEYGGGAFPSTHVSAVVILFLYMRHFFKKFSWVIGFFCVGIIVSTVYCSYHFTIDSITGIITGVIFYFIGRRFYSRFSNSGIELFES
ncbi:MAG: phosphatase PAP2 family protein [Candidatus Marinimicrobia bacterium]|nr:phosphatase PAP2 family protein [Candidatus Neomarinimicrobiota bacterium]